MQLAAAGHRVTSARHLREPAEAAFGEPGAHRPQGASWSRPTRWSGSLAEQFDAVLLDAPCSATGTFRRHPEVLYRARPRVIAEGAQLQQRLLARAADWVKPGGALVYSVCSLEPEEGEQVVQRFLESRNGLQVDAAARRRIAAIHRAGRARLRPDRARPARKRRRARRLLRRAPCPQRRLASNRAHGRAADRPLHPLRRFRAARRGSARDRRGRRRLDPHRRDGRPFRAQHHHRPGGGEGASPAQRQDLRLAT